MLRCWVGRRQLPALGPECSAAVDKSPPRGGKRTETARGARVCAVFTAQTAYLWLQLRCETRLLHTPRRSPECQGNLWAFHSTLVPGDRDPALRARCRKGERARLAARRPPGGARLRPRLCLSVRGARVGHVSLRPGRGRRRVRRGTALAAARIATPLPGRGESLLRFTQRFCADHSRAASCSGLRRLSAGPGTAATTQPVHRRRPQARKPKPEGVAVSARARHRGFPFRGGGGGRGVPRSPAPSGPGRAAACRAAPHISASLGRRVLPAGAVPGPLELGRAALCPLAPRVPVGGHPRSRVCDVALGPRPGAGPCH